MGKYWSRHTGTEVDNAITKVLNGDCGIQRVDVFGNQLPRGNDGEVDISWEYITSTGSWEPYLGADNSSGHITNSPNVEYIYRSGYYVRFGKICYISFKIKCRIISINSSSDENIATIHGIPFQAQSINELYWALTLNEFAQGEDGTGAGEPYIPNVTNNTPVTLRIFSGLQRIRLLYKNGKYAIRWGVSSDPKQRLWISASGWYPIV